MKNIYEFFLHIGTTKVTCLKTKRVTDDAKKIVAFASRQADGFDRGVVKDLAQASQTLRETVQYVLEGANESIIRARIVVSHPYIKNFIFGSSLYFYGNPHALTIRDVKEVIAQTRSVATIPLNEMIIQTVPQEFLVNDLGGISNPIGLEATRLGVVLRLFTMDYVIFSNLLRALERADIDAIDFVPVSLGSARAALSSEEKDEGVILVDVGGYSTRFDCYQNSILVDSRISDYGSEIITETLATHLNLKTEHARKLKETFISLRPQNEFSSELIPITDASGIEVKHVPRGKIDEESRAVTQNLVQQISETIINLSDLYKPMTQVVFTGGGSKLDGFLDAIQERIPHTLRIGVPRNLPDLPAPLADASHADIVGSIGYTSLILDPDYTPPVSNAFARVIDSAKRWVGEYF